MRRVYAMCTSGAILEEYELVEPRIRVVSKPGKGVCSVQVYIPGRGWVTIT